MSNFGNFSNIRKAFLGNTQISFLQRGANPMWSSPKQGPAVNFPQALLTTLGRAFDPMQDSANNRLFTDNVVTTAFLGDNVNRIDSVSSFSQSSSNTNTGAVTTRLSSNSTVGPGPKLVDHVGHRCLKFSGANSTNLIRIQSPMSFDFYNALTIGMMIYVDPTSSDGCIFNITRGEYTGGRTDIRLNIATDPLTSHKYISTRFRLDSTIYEDIHYNANTASSFTLKPGWRMLWLEWDMGIGNGAADAFISCQYGNDKATVAIPPMSYGLDAGDTTLNRVVVGARNNGVNSTDFFTGYIGRFFYCFRTYNNTEKEKIQTWLKSTNFTPDSNWVHPRGANTYFPYDVVKDYTSWAIDTWDPAIYIGSNTSGSLVSNTANVGYMRAITSGNIANANTAINGGPAFTQDIANNRPKMQSSWESPNLLSRFALVFNGANQYLQMANGVNYPSFHNGSFPRYRYDYAMLRVDPSIKAANASLGIVPFQEYNSSAPANNSVKPFWLDMRVFGGRFKFNSSSVVNTYITDSYKRIPPGWVWFETITTLANNSANGVVSQIFMNGEKIGNTYSTIVAGPELGANNILIGAQHNGTTLENFLQSSVCVGRSGTVYKNPSLEDRQKLYTWAQSMSYVGIPFPVDFMSTPFTAFGAAYDPYNIDSLSNTSIGNTITSWNPTFINNVRSDGLGTVTLQANTNGSPSANAPILASNSGFMCFNHANSRILIANTTGHFMRKTLQFSFGALVRAEGLSANTIEGVSHHHYRSVGTDYESYIGLNQVFKGSANNYPIMQMRAGNKGANSIIVSDETNNASQPFKHPSLSHWHAIIHSIEVSANTTGNVTVNYNVWLNGVKIISETKTKTPWLVDDYSKMTKYVIGGQLSDNGNLVANTSYNSYLGRNFWFEQKISSDGDAQLLTHWLLGRAYTPRGS